MKHEKVHLLWVVMFFLATLPFAGALLGFPTTLDYWHFLAKGERLLNGGAFSGPAPFVFTSPEGSVFWDKEWLFGVFIRFLWERTGHTGTILFRILIVSAWVAYFMRIAKRLGAMPWSTLLVFLLGGSTVLVQRMSIRPHIIGYLFLLILMNFAIETKPKRRHLMFTIALFILWANIHGSFVLGGLVLGSLGIWSLLEPIWSSEQAAAAPIQWGAWWKALLIVPFAVCINPYGWNLWKIIWMFQLEVSSRPDPVVTPEWSSFSFSDPQGFFLSCWVLFLALLFLFPENRKSWKWFFWSLPIVGLAFSNLRFVGIAFLLTGPVLAAQIVNLSPLIQRMIHTAMIGLLIFSLSQFLLYSPPLRFTESPQAIPVKPMDLLCSLRSKKEHKSSPSWKMFASLEPSGYILFRGHTFLRVAYDGFPVLPGFYEWTQEFKRAQLDAQEWLKYCEKHQCNLVLLDLKYKPSLLQSYLLATNASWRPIYLGLRWAAFSKARMFPDFEFPYLRTFIDPNHVKVGGSEKDWTRSLRRSKQISPGYKAWIQSLQIMDRLGLHPTKPWPPLTVEKKQQMKKVLHSLITAQKEAKWHPGVALGIGTVMAYFGDSRAKQFFQKSLEWNPRWLQPQLMMMRLYLQQKQHKKASLVWKKILLKQRLSPQQKQEIMSLIHSTTSRE